MDVIGSETFINKSSQEKYTLVIVSLPLPFALPLAELEKSRRNIVGKSGKNNFPRLVPSPFLLSDLTFSKVTALLLRGIDEDQ